MPVSFSFEYFAPKQYERCQRICPFYQFDGIPGVPKNARHLICCKFGSYLNLKFGIKQSKFG